MPWTTTTKHNRAEKMATVVVISSGAFLLLYGVAKVGWRYYTFHTSPLRKGFPFRFPFHQSFFFGIFFEFMKRPFMDPAKELWKQLRLKSNSKSGIPFLAYTTLLGRQSILVLDCDLLQHILTAPASKDPMTYPKRYWTLKEMVGNGLVSLEGRAWSRHRRLIQPAFSISFLRTALNTVVPPLTEQLIGVWKQTAGSTINLHSHMSALTIDIIGQVAFGHNFGASKLLEQWAKNPDHADLDAIQDPLIQSLNARLQLTYFGVALQILGLSWLHELLSDKARRTRTVLNQAVHDIIQNARLSSNKDKNSNDTHRSVLNIMMEAKDVSGSNSSSRNQLSDTELRDEIKTFVVAGHETSATWCYWTLYALAVHPHVQELLLADIAKHSAGSGTVLLEQADQMQYLWAVLNEVLRLYPPVGMVSRYAEKQMEWKGYTIPANTALRIPIHLIHRHPDHWTDPEAFLPQRWFDWDATDNRHKFAFLPFSAGARNCIGQRFAEMEVKLIVANLVKNFCISLANSMKDKEITFTNYITTKSKPPIEISVTIRE